MARNLLKTFSILLIAGILYGNVFAGTTPPVTTATLDPANPDGNNDWYVSPVQVTLQATDLGSGVKNTRYRINNGSWQLNEFEDTLNLAPNPSFETPSGNNTGLLNWGATLVDAFVTYSQDTTQYSPNYETSSAKIDSSQGPWHGINNSTNFAVTSSYQNMTAYLWLKTDNISEYAYFKIYAIHTVGGEQTETLIYESSKLTGTNGWTFISGNFSVSVDDAIGIYIDIGLDGQGTVWADAVNISQSMTSTQTVVNVGADNEYTLEYYSTDRLNNAETIKSLSFKIDQTPPGNWHDAGAFRSLSSADHILYVHTDVDDVTSGLSTLTDKYQYRTEFNAEFGKNADILKCNTDWLVGEWVGLISPPFDPGVNTAYLLTPKTNFCNNNWHDAKYVVFYAEDMAGNSSSKAYQINGPWIKLRGGGIVRAEGGINMIAEASDDNTDGLVEIGNNIHEFFTTSAGWLQTSAIQLNTSKYDDFWDETTSDKTLITGNIPTENGIYYYDGNFTISSSAIPGNYKSYEFSQIIFINGDLTISTELQIHQNSALALIVKGDVKIDKSVTNLEAGIISDGTISTAYNVQEGSPTSTLNLKGAFVANKFRLQRTLQGTNNSDTPSESFIYEPKLLVLLREITGNSQVKWLIIE